MTHPDFAKHLARGLDLFNRRRFWEAHEAWEDGWRPETGEPRRLLHGLIQVAAGFVKLQRGEPGGTVTLLGKGLEKLRGIPGARYRLDLERLVREVGAWRRQASAMVESGARDYDAAALPGLRTLPPSSSG